VDSTLNHTVPEYMGADLTDRYSSSCRGIDVCGLTRSEDGKLTASFWFWHWDAGPRTLDMTGVARELTAARAGMLDGPQGLATKGQSLRVCERQSAAVGKTPDRQPALARPFAGFIRSSLDIFAALRLAGIEISPSRFLGGVSEVYPGHIWTILCGRRALPKKSTDEGRAARKQILEVLGVSGLPSLPTHDQNDACVAAMLAAAADGNVPGLTAIGIGFPLFADVDGTLREGLMVVPEVTPKLGALISEVLPKVPAVDVIAADRRTHVDSESSPTNDRANGLLNQFILRALEGNPQVCTYSWAYRQLFNASYRKWSQAYVHKVLAVAQGTSPKELPGLGAVRLDAFVVAKSNGLPSHGHWQSARYDSEDWERILGAAVVLD
jgi:uncharacterized protein DUF429